MNWHIISGLFWDFHGNTNETFSAIYVFKLQIKKSDLNGHNVICLFGSFSSQIKKFRVYISMFHHQQLWLFWCFSTSKFVQEHNLINRKVLNLTTRVALVCKMSCCYGIEVCWLTNFQLSLEFASKCSSDTVTPSSLMAVSRILSLQWNCALGLKV